MGQDTALDQVVARVIKDGESDGGLNIEFQAHLLAQLRETPDKLGLSPSPTQLLRLAYRGHSHLNWVAYAGLTYESIAAVLTSAELRGAQALSLCIDHLNDSPTPLLETLAQSETIRDLCFLQGPARANDDKSSLLFSQIAASPSTSGVLSSTNLYLTCAFSAPLRRSFWVMDRRTSGLRYAPPVSAFPVQHMFVRQQFVGGPDDKRDEATMFRPCHFFLGDALLKPERLAGGFFQYCRSVLTDRFLFSFAAARSNLLPQEEEFLGTMISPIPAENFAIPERCSISSLSERMGGETEVECWPMFRGLEPNSWVLVVSHEWQTSPETRRRRAELHSQGFSGDSALGLPFVQYAFLRARKHITCYDPAGPTLDTLVQPEYIEVVGGVKEFLRETAPEVDERLVDACFDDTARVLRDRWLAELGPDIDFISLLDDATARSILKDFVQDATYVKENLRMAMQALPEGKMASSLQSV